MKTLDELIVEAKALVDAMTPEQKEEMIREQAKSWARGEMGWPKPKFHYETIDGVRTKVYDSYEDYCND